MCSELWSDERCERWHVRQGRGWRRGAAARRRGADGVPRSRAAVLGGRGQDLPPGSEPQASPKVAPGLPWCGRRRNHGAPRPDVAAGRDGLAGARLGGTPWPAAAADRGSGRAGPAARGALHRNIVGHPGLTSCARLGSRTRSGTARPGSTSRARSPAPAAATRRPDRACPRRAAPTSGWHTGRSWPSARTSPPLCPAGPFAQPSWRDGQVGVGPRGSAWPARVSSSSLVSWPARTRFSACRSPVRGRRGPP